MRPLFPIKGRSCEIEPNWYTLTWFAFAIQMMEVTATPNLEHDAIRTLYEASLNGCVRTLTTLMQSNPLILNRVSLSPFSETPLHIASLLGHLEFCQVLLERKPSLASEVDSEGRCPLHLASAEGHTEVVEALVQKNPHICMAVDKNDKLPLHLAAMRGRMGALQELIRARPDSIQVNIDDGSVLHLCIQYNHLEALKFLVRSVRGDQQFLLVRDSEGNTFLHLAVRLKQIKTIQYLVSLPEIRTAANALNRKGVTALEVLDLEGCLRDFISLKIEHMLIEAGVQRSADMYTAQPTPSPSIGNQEEPHHQSRRRKMWKTLWSKYLNDQGNWVEETRGTLMVVATVIATMTFQSTISPPGGVWQENTKDGGFNCTTTYTYGTCEAGTAVLACDWTPDFLNFMTFNTTSFFSSLCVVLLLISGFPLNNKVMMWVLTIAMTVSVTFMGLTYMWAQGLVTPNHILNKVFGMGYPLAIAWGAMLVVIGLIHTMRLVFWVKKRKKKKLDKSRRMSVRIGT